MKTQRMGILVEIIRILLHTIHSAENMQAQMGRD